MMKKKAIKSSSYELGKVIIVVVVVIIIIIIVLIIIIIIIIIKINYKMTIDKNHDIHQ